MTTRTMTDDLFLDHVADRLAALPGVEAVALGGSRAQGTHTADSDWDTAVYYRGPAFDPAALRAIGWEGEVSGIGEWGGGVFNGGAWLTVDGRRVDVHYRDLDVVEHEIEEAEAGRFRWEPLMFHLAGIPSYLVVAELAVNQVLRGQLPRPAYPEALRRAAPGVWLGRARTTLGYARANNAPRAQYTEVAGALATAAMEGGHAVLAARGEWVTNEKRLLERAGLRGIDAILAAASLPADGPARRDRLIEALDEVERLIVAAGRAG
ncbi:MULTISPECIES: nucleotidyltransferase domain-containing protein [Streptomyces]|uniref:nucleotidyltransferase domain-containing protein n=1 Tax=Streptomyces TaxID=1883 RepID=UPI001E4EA6FF|nr:MULTISPECIES: nucleotidyltransferase domain-containing protein [Streptomyces]UFQ15011.1 nucleotidyltransferase domain-containing protein [Streptomyces huasconensis]WCL84617.1 nucleotidyltransferase domain-containing protein [Streptomyces sp. JCM 35825]